MKPNLNSLGILKTAAVALSLLLVSQAAAEAPVGGARWATVIDIEAMQPSVLLVQGPLRREGIGSTYVRSTGSGTPVRWIGRTGILTAWHVVEKDKDREFTVSASGTGISTRFVRVGATDVAWADVARIPASWRPLDVAPVPIGSRCTAWGHPGGGRICACAGRVKAIDQTLNGRPGPWAHIDGAVSFGMSGGPVVDAWGRVFALNSMQAGETAGMAAVIPAGMPK